MYYTCYIDSTYGNTCFGANTEDNAYRDINQLVQEGVADASHVFIFDETDAEFDADGYMGGDVIVLYETVDDYRWEQASNRDEIESVLSDIRDKTVDYGETMIFYVEDALPF